MCLPYLLIYINFQFIFLLWQERGFCHRFVFHLYAFCSSNIQAVLTYTMAYTTYTYLCRKSNDTKEPPKTYFIGMFGKLHVSWIHWNKWNQKKCESIPSQKRESFELYRYTSMYSAHEYASYTRIYKDILWNRRKMMPRVYDRNKSNTERAIHMESGEAYDAVWVGMGLTLPSPEPRASYECRLSMFLNIMVDNSFTCSIRGTAWSNICPSGIVSSLPIRQTCVDVNAASSARYYLVRYMAYKFLF